MITNTPPYQIDRRWCFQFQIYPRHLISGSHHRHQSSKAHHPTYIHSCIITCTCMHTNTDTHAHKHSHTHTHTHTHTNTHTHTYTHKHTHTDSLPLQLHPLRKERKTHNIKLSAKLGTSTYATTGLDHINATVWEIDRKSMYWNVSPCL